MRLSGRSPSAREAARKTAEHREIQRKQQLMLQLTGTLQGNRRGAGKPR